MASIRAKRFLPLAFVLLPACSRHEASRDEIRNAAASCGLTVKSVEDGYGFDFVGTVVEVKKIEDADFGRRKNCIDWQFFFKSMERTDVTIENGPPGPAESHTMYGPDLSNNTK